MGSHSSYDTDVSIHIYVMAANQNLSMCNMYISAKIVLRRIASGIIIFMYVHIYLCTHVDISLYSTQGIYHNEFICSICLTRARAQNILNISVVALGKRGIPLYHINNGYSHSLAMSFISANSLINLNVLIGIFINRIK